MDFKDMNFTRRYHCPECNAMYIIIDNEIISCPVCDIAFNGKIREIIEEETSVLNLKFNKSSCT
ncbi:MAG: hypothetical protein ACFE9M_12890 [Promethearchaeota archaeon]